MAMLKWWFAFVIAIFLCFSMSTEAIRVVMTNEGKQVVGPSEFSGYYIQGTTSQPIRPPDQSRIRSTNDEPMPPDQSLIHGTNNVPMLPDQSFTYSTNYGRTGGN